MKVFDKAGSSLERRHDIDWLRVLAVLLLVPFHTARVFNTGEDFYVKNDQLSLGLDVFISFVSEWHMPLFFLVSGTATWFALGFRSGTRYAGERVRRLLIPLIFGILAIIPPQVYYMRLNGGYYGHAPDGVFSDSYLQFYPRFFDGLPPAGNFEWGHLWFLAYLFTFSLVALPLFLYLRSDGGRKLVSRLAEWCEKPGALYLLAAPLVLVQVALRAKWPGFQNLYDDWANFFFYITFFIYGYLLCSDRRFDDAIVKQRHISLMLAIVSVSLLFGWQFSGHAPAPDYSIQWILYMVLYGFTSWFCVVAILGFGRRYLNFTNGTLKYLSEAALPVYILHQTVIVMIGYYVVQWNMGVGGKFTVVTLGSLVMSLVVYDIAIRRFNPVRFCFGMKPNKRKVIPTKALNESAV